MNSGMSNKDKKSKKSHKKKIKEDSKAKDLEISEFDSEVAFNPYANEALTVDTPTQNINYSIDVKLNNQITLRGGKGHSNYYSKQSISTGTFYFEITVLSMEYNFLDYVNSRRTDEFSKKYYEGIVNNMSNYAPNIRVGVVRSSGDLELSLGANEHSYGYRARDGALINDGQYQFGNSFYGQGDTIGVLVHLKPPMPEFMKNTPQFQSNECYISFYKNNEKQSQRFLGIVEGDYHPAVTLYNFSQVSINFSPKLKEKLHEDLKTAKTFAECLI